MKAKCPNCNARYDYEEADGGQSITCECGVNVFLEPPPPPPPVAPPIAKPMAPPPPKESLCDQCLTPVPVRYPWQGRNLCGACYRVQSAADEERKTAKKAVEEVPDFTALRMVAGLIRVVGVLSCIGGFFVMMSAAGNGFDYAIAGVGVIVSGLIQLAAGEALECLRMMTINSYHIRQQTKKASE